MSESDMLELKRFIKAEMRIAVKEELSKHEHPLTDEMKENHTWMTKQRERGDKLTTVFFVVLISTLTGGLVTLVYAGIKAILGKQ